MIVECKGHHCRNVAPDAVRAFAAGWTLWWGQWFCPWCRGGGGAEELAYDRPVRPMVGSHGAALEEVWCAA